ncbi:uncharacterized protein LOC120343317 [Styela clava]
MTFASLWLVVILLINVISVGAAQEKKGSTSKLRTIPKRMHFQVRSQCKLFKTWKMKQLCNQVASDPNIVKMGRKVRAFVKNNDEKRFSKRMRKLSSNARALTIPTPPVDGFTMPSISRTLSSNTGFQCTKSCPSYSSLLSGKTPIQRSFSPWESCAHYDPLRFPQWLKLGFCSCKGCINPETKNEDMSFVSEPITVNITVLKRKPGVSFSECKNPNVGCEKALLEVTLGCTCVLPKGT